MPRVIPHEVPLAAVRTTAQSKRLFMLISDPRPDIRQAGDDAHDAGRERWANPYAEDTSAFVNWDAGWLDAKGRNK